jgi:hypothetical protein
MPFFDDSGPRPEEERKPIGRSFALVKDQLERLVLVNLLWTICCLPLMLAWAFEVSLPVRLLLTGITALALIPATAMLFALTAEVSEGIPLDWSVVRNSLKEQWKPSMLKLLPLYSLFYWLGLAAYLFSGRGLLIPDVLARLVFLLLAVLSLYWGALMIYQPELSAWKIFLRSVACFWKEPAQSLLIGVASLVTLLLGVISIAGFFLIAPVLVALFQVQLYRYVVKG